MAIYHLHVSTGSKKPPIDGKKQGQSAAAKYDYITRTPRYNTSGKPIPDIVSGNMPIWAENDTRDYWLAADTEERANGRLFKNIEFSLPVELSREDRRDLAIQFAESLTEDENLPYTLAIHEDKSGNPHSHLIISERPNDGIERDSKTWFKRYNAKDPASGGTKKTESLKPESWLELTRISWEAYANTALERAGFDVRIDHRSNEARGIDRETQVRVGHNLQTKAEREKINGQIKARNAELDRLDAEEAAIYWQLSVLKEQYRQLAAAEVVKKAKLEAAEKATVINAQQQEALCLAVRAAELTAGMAVMAEIAQKAVDIREAEAIEQPAPINQGIEFSTPPTITAEEAEKELQMEAAQIEHANRQKLREQTEIAEKTLVEIIEQKPKKQGLFGIGIFDFDYNDRLNAWEKERGKAYKAYHDAIEASEQAGNAREIYLQQAREARPELVKIIEADAERIFKEQERVKPKPEPTQGIIVLADGKAHAITNAVKFNDKSVQILHEGQYKLLKLQGGAKFIEMTKQEMADFHKQTKKPVGQQAQQERSQPRSAELGGR